MYLNVIHSSSLTRGSASAKMNPSVIIYIWVQSSPYLHIPIYTNICVIYPDMVVLFTPQHVHVGVLRRDPIYNIPTVHMSGDYVARHVCH